MSSAVFSTSAAPGRPFLFDDDPQSGGAPLAAWESTGQACPAAGQSRKPVGKQAAEWIQSTLGSRHIPLTSASHLQIRPMPEMASSGIAALDSLIGGLPRGCLTEICGPVSSGRTSVMLAAFAAATRRGEFCALIDASDALHPQSAVAAGIDLDRFLWVRCGQASPHRRGSTEKNFFEKPQCRGSLQPAKYQSEHHLEQVLRATDLLLESGGFGLIVLDLTDVPPQDARRIPLTTWFRFRRAVEHKPTILLAIEQQPIAGSCSSLLLNLRAAKRGNAGMQSVEPTPANLLSGLEIKIELIRSRLDRKPSHSVTFETTTAWTA